MDYLPPVTVEQVQFVQTFEIDIAKSFEEQSYELYSIVYLMNAHRFQALVEMEEEQLVKKNYLLQMYKNMEAYDAMIEALKNY